MLSNYPPTYGLRPVYFPPDEGEEDPLAGLSFVGRWQPERGNHIPFDLFQDPECTVPAVEEFDPIGGVRSYDGLLVLSQSDPDMKPVLVFEGGIPVLEFDGIDDYLELTGIDYNLASRTIYCVAAESVSVDGSAAVVFHPGSGHDFDQNTALCAIGFESGGSNLVVAGGAGVAYVIQRAGAKPTPWGVFSETLSAGSGALFADGVLVGTDTHGSFGVAPNLIVGARYISGAPEVRLNGRIAAILLADGVHSAPERALVEDYLMTLYASLL